MSAGTRRGIRLVIIWGLLAAQAVWPLSCLWMVEVMRGGPRAEPADLVGHDHGTLSRTVTVSVSWGAALIEDEWGDDRSDPGPVGVHWFWDTGRSVAYPRPDVGGPPPTGGSERWVDFAGLVAGHDWGEGVSASSEWWTLVIPWWVFVLPSFTLAAWLWRKDRRERRREQARTSFPVERTPVVVPKGCSARSG